jgi:hypothetical protein
MKKTQTSIVTNGTRAKRILNLFSTTNSKKQNSRDQSKESPKEMILLKSVKKKKTKTKKQKRHSGNSKKIDRRRSSEILMMRLKQKNQKRVSPLLHLHQHPPSSRARYLRHHSNPVPAPHSAPTPFQMLPSRHAPAYLSYWHGRKILHDDND